MTFDSYDGVVSPSGLEVVLMNSVGSRCRMQQGIEDSVVNMGRWDCGWLRSRMTPWN